MVSGVKTFLAVLGLLAIPVTYGLVTGWNPVPGLLNRLSKIHSLSQPAARWVVRAGDQPLSGASGGSTVVLFESGGVQARDARTGAQVWAGDADWAAMAGTAKAGGPVVLLGTRGEGYRVLDAADGRTRWSEPSALGAWTYTDMVVDITCPEVLSCTLRGRDPADGRVRWRAVLAGNGRAFAGANRPLAALRPLQGKEHSEAALIRPVPALLGFRLDDHVSVYSSRSGSLLRSYRSSSTRWVTVVGDRAVISEVGERGGTCRFTLIAEDPASGREVWRHDGYQPATGAGMGCDQREDQAGGGNLIEVHGPDGVDTLLDADTGAEAYRAPPTTVVESTDGDVILVRFTDRTSIRLLRRSGTPLWSRQVSRYATVSLGPGRVLVVDPDAQRLTALDTVSGRVVVDATTFADVLGYAEDGLVICSGRSVGLLTYGSVLG